MRYQAARPFPHAILDGLWPDDLLAEVVAEMPPPDAPGWRIYGGDMEDRKHEGGPHLWGPATVRLFGLLCSDDWLTFLTEMTGIEDLIPSAVGGGYHLIPEGGRLEVHTDFNEADGLYRRLNCLIYLNEGWTGQDGGALVLGAPDERVSIVPLLNRTVIFTTSDSSLHGHPDPVAAGKVRRSAAIYYFTAAPPADFSSPHSTVWGS